MNHNNGFTLIELLASMAIISILLLAGIPAYRDLVFNSKTTATVNTFILEVRKARSYAQANNTPVSICKSSNGTSCIGHWQDGLLMFTDSDEDGWLDEDDTIIYWSQPDSRFFRISWRAFANRQSLTFPGTGRFKYNGTFTFCPVNGDMKYAKQLVINIAGRPRIQSETRDDGTVVDRYGRPLDCRG